MGGGAKPKPRGGALYWIFGFPRFSGSRTPPQYWNMRLGGGLQLGTLAEGGTEGRKGKSQKEIPNRESPTGDPQKEIPKREFPKGNPQKGNPQRGSPKGIISKKRIPKRKVPNTCVGSPGPPASPASTPGGQAQAPPPLILDFHFSAISGPPDPPPNTGTGLGPPPPSGECHLLRPLL